MKEMENPHLQSNYRSLANSITVFVNKDELEEDEEKETIKFDELYKKDFIQDYFETKDNGEFNILTTETSKQKGGDSDEEIGSLKRDFDQEIKQLQAFEIQKSQGVKSNQKESKTLDGDEEKNESNGISIYDDSGDQDKVVVEDAPFDSKAFEVVDPIKGSHVTYTIKGYDNDGKFEGNRRYNDFFHLRNALLLRMPGVYIPPIPPKKAIGNKNDKFLEERKHFLQRFLQISCRIPYIINSEEFKIFSRPVADIEKLLESLPHVTPEFILKRFKSELRMRRQRDEKVAQENRALINSYIAFIKKMLPVLKSIRDKIKPMISVRDTHNSNFKDMIFLMSKYEEGALLQYAELKTDKLVVGNSLNPLYTLKYN